jgi:predicted SnoaL-like aldol condensation-catalyzing enzyme
VCVGWHHVGRKGFRPSTSAGAHDTGRSALMSTEENKTVARRWSEKLWGRGELAVADEIVVPDYVRHDPADPFPANGPEALQRIVGMLREMLPDLRIEVEDMIAEGEKVVVRYTGIATYSRDFMGRAPTGRRSGRLRSRASASQEGRSPRAGRCATTSAGYASSVTSPLLPDRATEHVAATGGAGMPPASEKANHKERLL